MNRDRAAHRWIRCAALLGALALLGSCGGGGSAAAPAAEPAPLVAPRVAAETAAETTDETTDDAAPQRVRVPRLGIDAALEPLILSPALELLPPEYGRAGWYEDGPEPGEPGRAVIAGHVDSRTGPDVFAALGRARAGDKITVDYPDGSVVSFRVHEVEVHPRDDFPTSRVYGSGEDAELRLITCTGEYDRARGGYQDNVVVFARLDR